MGANEPVLNKAILIIDMPENCAYCMCSDGEYGTCNAIHYFRECDWQGRPQWCPLKPLPKREPEYFTSNGEEVHDVYFQGWNDCLDEILGGKNG